jgi:hypothetical protein
MLRLFLKSSNNCSGRSFVKMSAIWLRDITCMYNNSVQWRSEVKQRIMRLSRVSQVSNHKSYSSLLRQRQCCLLLFNINTQNILKLIFTLCMKMLLKVKYVLYMSCWHFYKGHSCTNLMTSKIVSTFVNLQFRLGSVLE